MIRCGYWPDDARGPQLVLSFESDDEVRLLLKELETLAKVGKELKFSKIEGVHLSGLPELTFKMSDVGKSDFGNSEFTVTLSKSSLGELIDKLSDLETTVVKGHNYVAIDTNLDLLIAKGEYSDQQLP